MTWLNQEVLTVVSPRLTAVVAVLVAVANVYRVSTAAKQTKIQKESTDQIVKAIHDVRQSIRRSAAWICLAVTVLVLAVLSLGWNPGGNP